MGLLTFGGAVRAFTCDQFFKAYKNKEGRKRIYQGTFLLSIGFCLCYGWLFLKNNDFFKHFENETYGTPTFLIEKRLKEKEESKIKEEEIKKQAIEKEKEAKLRKKYLEKQSKKDSD